MIGYRYFVQNAGAESTNCGLHGPGETDYHVGIGFNRTIAQGLQDGHTPSDIEVKRLQQTSVVVEMTPHYRAQFKPKWTDTFLRRFIGRQVRVVGQLMLDNDHTRPQDNCADANADEDRCWRMTAWEIHRSEERRVGKEWRSRRAAAHDRKTNGGKDKASTT